MPLVTADNHKLCSQWATASQVIVPPEEEGLIDPTSPGCLEEEGTVTGHLLQMSTQAEGKQGLAQAVRFRAHVLNNHCPHCRSHASFAPGHQLTGKS